MNVGGGRAERIEYQNSLLAIKIIEVRNSWEKDRVRWHYHKELEIVLVRKGSVVFHTVEQSYQLRPGDVLLLGSNQLHTSQRIECPEAKYIVLHVDLLSYFEQAIMPYYHYFSEVYRPLSELNYIFWNNDRVKRKVALSILSIYKEMQMKSNGFEIAVSIKVKQILLDIFRNDDKHSLGTRIGRDVHTLEPIFLYVEQRLSEKIEMKEACQLLNMSYSYFSKYFKDMIGTTFINFVNFKRIQMAERYLATTTASISEVASMVGLENLSHFYHLFKRYKGCTPKQYVTRLQQDAKPLNPSE